MGYFGGYKPFAKHLLTIDPNFQPDIQERVHCPSTVKNTGGLGKQESTQTEAM